MGCHTIGFSNVGFGPDFRVERLDVGVFNPLCLIGEALVVENVSMIDACESASPIAKRTI